jgi:hypothetical protein
MLFPALARTMLLEKQNAAVAERNNEEGGNNPHLSVKEIRQ